ncbi:uncharacterized protein LOC117182595 [Belonocnema kinseyi]|uniref:uncharacterized protein LOC117182595 n=1 Tax=Belonocnema kinseyi TaxID=2817044 RepID=UPI00143DF151|nr:uncharacterized protein LOC117182595 [Belonocnema kinseyi]
MYYRPDEAKWNLAESLVAEFPSLRSEYGDYGCIQEEFKRIMISVDFKDEFLGVFLASYVQKMFAYCKMEKPKIYKEALATIKDDNLRAVSILPELLPNTNFVLGKRAKENKVGKAAKKVYSTSDILSHS